MAGCKKVDRKRKKSPAQARYRAANRSETNRLRKQAKEEKAQKRKAQRYFDGKIKERGLTRKLRRKHGKATKTGHSTTKQEQTTKTVSQLRRALQRGGYTR